MNGTPIELQRRTIAREKVFPVWRLTGYRPTRVADGHLTATLPTSAWFSNGGPSMYGGMLAWASEFTMGAAVYSTLSAGDLFATLDMHIRFTRPALINSGDLTLTASVRHRGRLLRVTSCEVDNAEGKRVAMATSSALVVEGGVCKLKKGRLPEEILAEAERSADPPIMGVFAEGGGSSQGKKLRASFPEFSEAGKNRPVSKGGGDTPWRLLSIHSA